MRNDDDDDVGDGIRSVRLSQSASNETWGTCLSSIYNYRPMQTLILVAARGHIGIHSRSVANCWMLMRNYEVVIGRAQLSNRSAWFVFVIGAKVLPWTNRVLIHSHRVHCVHTLNTGCLMNSVGIRRNMLVIMTAHVRVYDWAQIANYLVAPSAISSIA